VELFLMRHGEAQESTVNPARPLTERGRAAVERVAAEAKRRGVHVSRICHSGILRAEQTAEALAQQVGAGEPIEVRAGLEPEDPVAPISEWLLELTEDPAGEAIALVGHLPLLERLTASLLGGPRALDTPAFQPATLVKLAPAADGRHFEIVWVIRPDARPEP
jgi:phosphohistidine phosphatase